MGCAWASRMPDPNPVPSSHIDGIPGRVSASRKALRFYATVEGVEEREVEAVVGKLGIERTPRGPGFFSELSAGPEEAGLHRPGLSPGAEHLSPR